MHVIKLSGVSKSYRQGGFFSTTKTVHVLSGIDLAIEPGSCVGLLGRSGSGKSTLGRLVLGLEKPDQGEVLFEGKPLDRLSKEDFKTFRRNVQVVFQNSLGSVNPRFTAADIIAEPLKNFESHSQKKLNETIENLLDWVGLSAADMTKLPHQFSGGELQRICIARAMALSPKLIVLDEAVSSLDMLIQARIIDLLVDLQRTLGTAYLFISHDIRVLLKMADRLAVLSEGMIVEEVHPARIDGQNGHPAMTSLINAILPPLPGAAA